MKDTPTSKIVAVTAASKVGPTPSVQGITPTSTPEMGRLAAMVESQGAQIAAMMKALIPSNKRALSVSEG